MSRGRTRKADGGPYFGFRPGRMLERRYLIGDFIGYGYEGEVYQIREASTGIERVVKFFYPDRYADPRHSVRVARKFHKLRNCSVVLQYHSHGEIGWRGLKVGYMVSELAPGRKLWDLLREQRRKRFHPFEALHIIHATAVGVAEIHALHEYHGDIHEDNILVERVGVGFRVKLIDLFLHKRDTPDRRLMDVADLCNLLYLLVGGPSGYPRSPRLVKEIVCGRRRETIYRKFPSAGALAGFMEQFPWPE